MNKEKSLVQSMKGYKIEYKVASIKGRNTKHCITVINNGGKCRKSVLCGGGGTKFNVSAASNLVVLSLPLTSITCNHCKKIINNRKVDTIKHAYPEFPNIPYFEDVSNYKRCDFMAGLKIIDSLLKNKQYQ